VSTAFAWQAPTNGGAIEAEIDWFTALLDLRFRMHGGERPVCDILAALPPPPLPDESLPFAEGLLDAGLEAGERLILILALLPYLRPHALDPFLIHNSHSGRPFTEFGGVAPPGQNGFRPTRETALFLLAGESMEARLRVLPLFSEDGRLERRGILATPSEPAEPGPWTPLTVSPRWLGRLTVGASAFPRFGPEFPAQRIETRHEWDDLVLPPDLHDEIEDLVTWVKYERILLEEWGLSRQVKPGYRALFHGPPGTGKTMAASVLGSRLGLPVYRVDLSRVVSKWIGETEKNLGALFDEAAEGRMILFFDEADALFGKRGETRSANDRHANQQIAYLLQRIEDSPGVTILASNLKANIDAAFARRFQAMVYFPIPDATARLQLWQAGLSGIPGNRRGKIDLAAVARDHELSGGSIVNVVRRCCLQLLGAGERSLDDELLRSAIRRELSKSGGAG
jgi:hypothetical protein